LRCERWFWLILVELLTIIQWVEVRGDFCWYWWNCWPSLNELNRGVIFVDIGGGIVDHHSMHWVMVNNSTNINKNHLSPQLIEWRSTIPPISTRIISHLNSLSDGQQFHQRWCLLILVELLTIIQWVEVRGDFCWYWWICWPSPNELRWEVIFVDISGIVETHWVMVSNSTNINKNYLSPQLIEWWSTIPPISANITSHLNSLSDGQQFHQYQQQSLLTTTH
jgi:hypothetical protein